jgi:hypothetical protein
VVVGLIGKDAKKDVAPGWVAAGDMPMTKFQDADTRQTTPPLEQRRRSERALVAVVAECYVRGAAAPTLRCAAVPADPAPAPGLPSPAPPMTGSGARPPRRG